MSIDCDVFHHYPSVCLFVEISRDMRRKTHGVPRGKGIQKGMARKTVHHWMLIHFTRALMLLWGHFLRLPIMCSKERILSWGPCTLILRAIKLWRLRDVPIASGSRTTLGVRTRGFVLLVGEYGGVAIVVNPGRLLVTISSQDDADLSEKLTPRSEEMRPSEGTSRQRVIARCKACIAAGRRYPSGLKNLWCCGGLCFRNKKG